MPKTMVVPNDFVMKTILYIVFKADLVDLVPNPNLFGVKMFGIPDGAAQNPNSPMLRIELDEIPPELKPRYDRISSTIIKSLQALRDQLHVWTFVNARLIDTAYRRLFPRPAERKADFTAPLKVIAELAGGTELTPGLTLALRENRESVVDASNPIELMIKATRNLVREGYHDISATYFARNEVHPRNGILSAARRRATMGKSRMNVRTRKTLIPNKISFKIANDSFAGLFENGSDFPKNSDLYRSEKIFGFETVSFTASDLKYFFRSICEK